MTVTREVIRDLVGGYIAGECTADTRTLVEEFAAKDAEVARWIAEARRERALPPPPAPRPDAELATIRRTRRAVTRRSWLMAGAIFFSALPLSVHGDSSGVTWLAAEQPFLAAAFAAVGAALWIAFAAQARRVRDAGL